MINNLMAHLCIASETALFIVLFIGYYGHSITLSLATSFLVSRIVSLRDEL